jgi:hypothetical protein
MKTFIIIVFLATGGSTLYRLQAMDREEAIDFVTPLCSPDDSITVM